MLCSIAQARDKIGEIANRLKDFKEKAVDLLNPASSEVASLILSPRPRPLLRLDDAVNVLRTLTSTIKSSTKPVSRAEIDTLVSQGVQKALMAMQKSGKPGFFSASNQGNAGASTSGNIRSSSGRKGKNNSRGSNAKPAGAPDSSRSGKRRRPEDSRCYDCGELGHFRGDLDCEQPSYQTKRLRRNNENHTKKGNKEKGNYGNSVHFRKGSNTKNNEA